MQKDWARTVPVGVEKTKQILEIHRRQIRRTECGERSLRESLGFWYENWVDVGWGYL